MAVGSEAVLPGAIEDGDPAIDTGRTDHHPVIGDLQPDLGECLAVAAEASARDAVRIGLSRCRRLDAEDQDLAVAQARDVLGGCPRTTDVVDLDGAVLRERGRVHEHDRKARPADLLHLGVGIAQSDGDHAVHRGPAHRPGKAAVQRRDEVEAVSVLLGNEGDTLTERPEERVAEDDAQGLRSEDADRHRLPLGQHAGDRVRRVPELLGDFADPDRGIRRQAIG